MNRRGVTVLIGVLLVAGLTFLVGNAEVPYVEMRPGPTYDTLGVDEKDSKIITLSGAPATESEGELRFVTVGVRPHPTVVDVLRGWWSSEIAVVPYELIYPPDKTVEEVEEENRQYFVDSQVSAETAALTALGYPRRVAVETITPGSSLRANDIVESVNGTAVTTPEQLNDLVKAPGAASVVVDRDGTKVTLQQELGPAVKLEPKYVQPHPFQLSVKVAEVGGPSAGLMLALGIVDTVRPVDLTGGMIIAGTGAIDEAGNVGEIGGVPQKLVAAKRDGATVFLTPEGDCEIAVANAVEGLTLVKVATLGDALTALDALREGRRPELCQAG